MELFLHIGVEVTFSCPFTFTPSVTQTFLHVLKRFSQKDTLKVPFTYSRHRLVEKTAAKSKEKPLKRPPPAVSQKATRTASKDQGRKGSVSQRICKR